MCRVPALAWIQGWPVVLHIERSERPWSVSKSGKEGRSEKFGI